MKTFQLCVAMIGLVFLANMSFAQFPGDGVPDVYVFCGNFDFVQTSVGSITRPRGTILVDTDGTDMVTLLMEGPNLLLTTPDDGNFLVGSTANLPDPNNPPFNTSAWTSGYIAGKSQWVRTNPLDSDGFVGVIGEYDDPLGVFPDLGVAFTTNPAAFSFANVIYATSESGTFATNPELGQMSMGPVFGSFPFGCIPEPTSTSFVGFGLLGWLTMRRRV